jgi:hypothetical protein
MYFELQFPKFEVCLIFTETVSCIYFMTLCLRSAQPDKNNYIYVLSFLCGLVVRVLGYRSGGPGSITGTTSKKK